MQTTAITRPMPVSTQVRITPTSASVMPSATSGGRYDGSGRWTSSDGGGTAPPWSSSAIAACLGRRRDEEGRAEDEEADGARDQRGPQVLVGEPPVHAPCRSTTYRRL